jgi:predicted ester cyclase
MEAMAAARDPALRASRLALLRQPLSWAAVAALVGCALGLLGTFREAAWVVSQEAALSATLFAPVAKASGQLLVAVSLLGVPSLLGDGPIKSERWTSVSGGVLILLVVASTAASPLFFWLAPPNPSLPYAASFWVSVLLLAVVLLPPVVLPPAVALPYAVAAFLDRKARLGALLAGLCALNLPFLRIQELLFPPDPDFYWEPSAAPVLLGGNGWGVGLPEAPLWVLLGWLLLRAARWRSYGEAARLEAKENAKRARRLYEEGLGRNEPSAVEGLISKDFRDLRRGARGRLAMERFVSELWASYPDLSVSVEGQETEGDVVRSSVVLSGTDRGRGVMWYPPTGRRVSFEAWFVDRFRGGKLVEHVGEADTEELLRQLGHRREGGATG